jgi:nickel superoxide dismutase
MNRRILTTLVALSVIGGASSVALAHCQIPCGIYNDPLRFTLMEEDITTIEKAMKQIAELSQQPQPNLNQIVRWIDNKDTHADRLTEIVTYYFMAQRVKPADPADEVAYAKYLKQITTLHRIMIEAMKAKQTTDLEHCAALRLLVDEFRKSYLGEQAQATAEHHEHAHAAQAQPSEAHAHR